VPWDPSWDVVEEDPWGPSRVTVEEDPWGPSRVTVEEDPWGPSRVTVEEDPWGSSYVDVLEYWDPSTETWTTDVLEDREEAQEEEEVVEQVAWDPTHPDYYKTRPNRVPNLVTFHLQFGTQLIESERIVNGHFDMSSLGALYDDDVVTLDSHGFEKCKLKPSWYMKNIPAISVKFDCNRSYWIYCHKDLANNPNGCLGFRMTYDDFGTETSNNTALYATLGEFVGSDKNSVGTDNF